MADGERVADEQIEAAAAAIGEASALVVGAGAGMGVDSGLPDFRGPEGFWRAYPPYRDKGLEFTDLANPQWFHRDPAFAWGFYGHRLELYRRTTPHEGFSILQQWAQARAHGLFVTTSNVDGQFQKAGFSKERVLEAHGSIHVLQHVDAREDTLIPADPYSVTVDESTMRAQEPLPRDEHGALLRPNILMFGDGAFVQRRAEEQFRQFRSWLDEVGDEPLVVVECGAGSAVPTIRMQCERLTAGGNATLIRINLRESDVPRGGIGIAAGALEALRRIDERLRSYA